MTWPGWLVDTVVAFNWAVLFYFLALNSLYLVLFLISLSRVRQFVQRTFFSDYRRIMDSQMTWPISVLVAAHDEEKTIIETVRSLMMVNYSEFEIIVINDGSTDETLERLTEAFEMRRVDRVYKRSLETGPVRGVYTSLTYPNLLVIDKEHRGKSDALNAGINLSRYPLYCTIDADSMIEDNALLRVVKPFMDAPDETVATGGIVRIANGCQVKDGHVTHIELPDRPWPIFQAVEYLRAFLSGRVGWSAMHSLLLISGAFGLYSKKHVIEVGGYSTETDTEDLELIVRLHRHLRRERRPYRVVFVPDPVCWTEVPDELGSLLRQRTRWHRGLAQTLWRNRGMLGNPRYGSVGTFAFPYFFVFEMLGPFVEILGYIAVALAWLMGLLNMQFFVLFLLAAIVYGSFLSICAVLLEEISFRRYPHWLDLTKLILFGVLENFGYRQMLSLFKIKAFWDLLWRRRAWGRIERAGFKGEPTADDEDDSAEPPASSTPPGRVAGLSAGLLLALLLQPGVIGQEPRGSDEIFAEARQMAHEEGRREEARALCRELLEQSPGYTDARVLLGRLWAWDKQYDAARRELRLALESSPDNADARLALVDVELWSDRPAEALRLADTGLAQRPDDGALLDRRARALADLGRADEALDVAHRAWEISPGLETLRRYTRLLDDTLRNKAGVDYDYETFDDNLEDWHQLSLEYRHGFDWGSLIGRINLARRFGDSGTQFEIDSYPKLPGKNYLYTNIGFSSTSFFPELRYGAEWYHNYRRGWETSLGFRRLEFSRSSVTIYTGTLAKYFGKYWISWRPQISVDGDGTGTSNGISLRRYYGTRFEYAEISASVGDDNDFSLVTDQSENLDGFRIRFEMRKRIKPRILLKGKIGYRYDELDVDRDRGSIFVGFGVDYYF